MSPRIVTNGHFIYFTNLSPSDLGKYKCTITNDFDSSEKTVVIYEDEERIKFLVEQEQVKLLQEELFKVKIFLLSKNLTSIELVCDIGKILNILFSIYN